MIDESNYVDCFKNFSFLKAQTEWFSLFLSIYIAVTYLITIWKKNIIKQSLPFSLTLSFVFFSLSLNLAFSLITSVFCFFYGIDISVCGILLKQESLVQNKKKERFW